MMLTQRTAQSVGVSSRIDAKQSIFGGAEYLHQMHERVGDGVEEPDRTWLALAAYNVGIGHLRDAQKIVKRHRGNPDSWLDVKQALPLLAKREYYSKTKFGYARGWEPVRYVENIRTYYRIMQWSYPEEGEQLPDDAPNTIARLAPLVSEAVSYTHLTLPTKA